MKGTFVCPNCGKAIDIQFSGSSVTCLHCHEALLVSSDKKIVLANPLRTYLISDDAAAKDKHRNSQMPVGKRPPVSAERRKKTARFAYERMTQQEQLDHSGLAYGILAIVFGGLLGVLGWLRLEFIQSDWISWIGLWTGVLVFGFGTFLTIWFYRSIKSAKEIRREIEKEMKG